MKLVEHYSDYNMVSDKKAINTHNYRRYRIGRLKHEFWLKTRKSADTVYMDTHDWFILKNLKPGRTCYFSSAGYYVEDLVPDLTVVEQWPVVKSFYPNATIVEHRKELGELFPQQFDNFVVINNSGDRWLDLDGLEHYFQLYSRAMKPGALFFYSCRDTQFRRVNRLKEDHYKYFYNFATRVASTCDLNLLWHDIKFAEKIKKPDGTYDFLENPDTTNGNLKFVFQYKDNSASIDV